MTEGYTFKYLHSLNDSSFHPVNAANGVIRRAIFMDPGS